MVLCVMVSMPIRQLQDDVNEIEEAELRRLDKVQRRLAMVLMMKRRWR